MEYKKVKFRLEPKKQIFYKPKSSRIPKTYKAVQTKLFPYNLFKPMTKIAIPIPSKKNVIKSEGVKILYKLETNVVARFPGKYILTSANLKYARKVVRWGDTIQYKHKERIELVDDNNLRYHVPEIKKQSIAINMKNTDGIERYVMRIRQFCNVIELYDSGSWIFEYKNKKYKSIKKLKKMIS